MAGFYFSHVPVFKIRGVRVVGERRTLLPRLPVPNEVLNLASVVPPVVGAVGGVSFSPPLVIKVRGGPSSPPSIVEGRDGSPSLLLETSVSLPIDAQHQDKENGVSISEGEKMASKRGLKDRDVVIDFGRIKKSRTTLLEETSDSNPTSPIAAPDPFPDSFDWTGCINIGSH
ncbi:hypothetical protein Fot_19459 [Forsythia ovata]|uniref:Uncharacterized protein n=1 Tax=Forsythia ovata TaxID=205694 RepID=A0ABD1VN53_9LAMI